MKEIYTKPTLEVINFQEQKIYTSNGTSTLEFPIDDWFEEGNS